MDVGFGFVRQVEIDDEPDVFHIDSACRDVGGDENGREAFLEFFERLLALRLRLVAVDRIGWEAGLAKAFREFVSAVFGAAEDDGELACRRRGLAAEKLFEQRALVFAVHETNLVLDALGGGRPRINANAGRVAQNGLREIDDAGREGRREEQRLAVRWQQRDDFFHIAGEAHVEHPVHFVQDEELDTGEIHGALFDEIDQTAGSRHQDVHAAAHRGDLRILADATVDQRLLETDVSTVSGETLADLAGQFAGRCQHQRAALARLDLLGPLVDRMEDRQGETRCFAGAGLGATEKVAAFQQQRNGLGLDRRWSGVVQLAQNALQGRGQWQRLEFSRGHVYKLPAHPISEAGGVDERLE